MFQRIGLPSFKTNALVRNGGWKTMSSPKGLLILFTGRGGFGGVVGCPMKGHKSIGSERFFSRCSGFKFLNMIVLSPKKSCCCININMCDMCVFQFYPNILEANFATQISLDTWGLCWWFFAPLSVHGTTHQV